MKDCYVYTYCDPRVRCESEYFGVRLEFLPIYVVYGRHDRMMWHLKFRKGDRNLLKIHKLKAIIAGGNQPIVLKVVEGLGQDEAQEMERKWIAEIGSISEIPGIKRGSLTNLTVGGDGGATWINRKMTNDHKEKIRKANTGVPFTEERKRHLSEAQRRRVIIISEEKRKKMVDGIHRMTKEEHLRGADSWRGKVWINKGGNHKRVKELDIEIFLRDGWKRGFTQGGNQHHRKDQCKECGIREVESPEGTVEVFDERELV